MKPPLIGCFSAGPDNSVTFECCVSYAGRPTRIDRYDCASDPARLVGGEEQCRLSYVVGLAHAEQMFFVGVLIAGHEFFHSLGKGRARRKCVDPDMVLSVFDR
jgi:hypothetical protein